jgi:hypothetical protein
MISRQHTVGECVELLTRTSEGSFSDEAMAFVNASLIRQIAFFPGRFRVAKKMLCAA